MILCYYFYGGIMLCKICPRNCNIDRKNNKGFCSCTENMTISKTMLHHWEEPIISGDENSNGSGAIFFAGCNLKCVYCQNHQISNSDAGKTININELITIFKEFETKKATNINLITPTHFTRQILAALKKYKPSIPIVWNSSGYELASEIKKLKKYVDIYLVDLKYLDSTLSKKYSHAEDYPKYAKSAIRQMKINQPIDIIENGLMKNGVIIRHLVLPLNIENSFKCLDYIKDNYGTDQFVSIMAQYCPCHLASQYTEINRKLHPIEYKRVLNHISQLGFNNGFVQDLDSANLCFTPKF